MIQPLTRVLNAHERFKQRTGKVPCVLFIGQDSFMEAQFIEIMRDKTPFLKGAGKTGRSFWGMVIVIDTSLASEEFRVE